MRLQTKIILVTLMVFIISFSFMGILIFSNSRLILEKQIETKLISLSQINEKNIQTFLNGQKNKIELIATQDELTNEELKEMISLDDSFYEIFVIGSNGTVLVSSNPERVGLDRANRSYFINARNNTYINPVYFALVPQEYSIATSTPFQGGVLVGAIKLDTLNKIVSDRTGLGKTEEMLMAFINEKEEVVYFTKRIFSDKKIEILTKEDSRDHPIYYAFQKEEVLLKGLKNYRGAEVISFTNYVDEIQVGMLTQIDIAEAFSEIENLKKITFFLVIIMIILTTIVIYIVARQVAKEIIYISESIDKVTKGDLGMQLKKSSLYEIQTLINSLNRILASMKLAILRTGVSASDLGIGEVVRAKEEAEEKYNNLYENSSDAMMIIEPPSWKFTRANPVTITMFKAENEEEFLKKTPGDVSPEKQPDGSLSSEKSKKMIEKAMKSGKASFEWTHKRLNGEEFPASVLLIRFKLNGKEIIQATVRDLSEEKEMKTKENEKKPVESHKYVLKRNKKND